LKAGLDEDEIDTFTERLSEELSTGVGQTHAIPGMRERGEKEQTRISVRVARQNDRSQRRWSVRQDRLEWVTRGGSGK
jgi:hypothetical protein